MVYVLIFILLIIVAIFGISSGMQSYATAQQAQAQIETARAAQANAIGNLITIIILALVIMVVIALIVAVLWWMVKKRLGQSPGRGTLAISRPRVSHDQPPIDINTLMQLKMLDVLSSIGQKPGENKTSISLQETNDADPNSTFPWLR